jgi:hypothetical protein
MGKIHVRSWRCFFAFAVAVAFMGLEKKNQQAEDQDHPKRLISIISMALDCLYPLIYTMIFASIS